MLVREIETKLSAFELYTVFKDREDSFFLDSGMDSEKLGQFSFIGFDPILRFVSKGEDVVITKDGAEERLRGNPFDELQRVLSKYKMDYISELPFVGGAVGYFSYDLCHHVEKLPRTAIDDVDIPDAYFGIYDGVIAIDHRGGKDKVYIACLGVKGDEVELFEDISKTIQESELQGVVIDLPKKEKKSEFKSNFKSKEDYKNSIRAVQEYIRTGDIYQANLTQRFEAELGEDPYALYGKLRDINPAPFASFLNYDGFQIVSSSPERFIKLKDGIIETRPIKGTIPRGKTEEEDQANREELLSSEKDRAELLMIVDLERNDLGRVAKTGTVEVTELFHLEEYATVYHLVSTVRAEVKDEHDAIDCVKATFPGGSITGAPKIRSMEVIDELEPTQRNIYTGSIGYIGLNGDMDLNIVIRTVVCKDNKAYFQVGGGITWDSDPQLEYEETLHKARAIMEALNT